MLPISHLATAFISPAAHAGSNICDNRLGALHKNNLTTLIAVSSILQFIIVFPLFLIFPPSWPLSLATLATILVVALIEFTYIYPYFWAMRHTDTSVVAALFSLGRIFVPLLAWLVVSETLQPLQYTGFALITLGSLMLTFNWRKFHLNIAAVFMLLSSLLVAISAVLTKHVFLTGITWSTFTATCMGAQAIGGLTLLLIMPHATRRFIRTLTPGSTGLVGMESLFSTIGNAGENLAVSLLPVSIVKGIAGTQPFFVMLYAAALRPRFPKLSRENFSGVPFITKLAAFAVIILGTLLSLGH